MDSNQSLSTGRTPTVSTSAPMASFYEAPKDTERTVTPETEQKNEQDKEAESAPAEQKAEVLTDEDQEQVEEVKKTSPKLQERFSKLTNDRKTAQEQARIAAEEARVARESLAAIQAERDALKQKYEPPKTQIGPKPVLSEFTNQSEYEKAMETWAGEKAEFDLTKKQAEQAAKEHSERVNKAWNEKIGSAIKEIADFQDIVIKSTAPVSNEMQEAIMEADNGAAIIYHLAKNPDIAEKLVKMSVAVMNREIGKLDAKLDKGDAQKGTQTIAQTAAAQISKAPAPITPSRGVAAVHDNYTRESQPPRTYEQWKKLRESGKIGDGY